MSTVAPAPLTFESLSALVLELSMLVVRAEHHGLFISRPIIHGVPRSLFRQLDVPQQLLVVSTDRVVYSKEWRDVTVFCDQHEDDLPEFAVLEPFERGADWAEPEACCSPLSLWCPRCHKGEPRTPDAA